MRSINKMLIASSFMHKLPAMGLAANLWFSNAVRGKQSHSQRSIHWRRPNGERTINRVSIGRTSPDIIPREMRKGRQQWQQLYRNGATY
jgi:hypothetical protein